jgi:hypothetical protein
LVAAAEERSSKRREAVGKERGGRKEGAVEKDIG